MSNPTFNARDLWASMGVPYVENDTITPVITSSVRTMIFAGHWRTASALDLSGFELPTNSALKGASGLNVDVSVV